MAQITAALVKELREKTGAGMMDCKKALSENNADIEGASDWLRTKGLAAAAKKAGRTASEGLVGVAVEGTRGAVVEINSETDFVARNETFQEFVASIAKVALETGDDVEALKDAAYPGTDRTVNEQLTHLISTIGENMSIRRIQTLNAENGYLASYIHNAIAPNLGKIAVLVGFNVDGDGTALAAIGKQVAMHVAAAKPLAVNRDELDPNVVAKEKTILSDQARDSGRPENIIEKMVEGRMRKFYEESCLVDQTFVIDGESKVGEAVEKAANDAGIKAFVASFEMYVLGEGIEKKQEDFAAEVAAVTGG